MRTRDKWCASRNVNLQSPNGVTEDWHLERRGWTKQWRVDIYIIREYETLISRIHDFGKIIWEGVCRHFVLSCILLSTLGHCSSFYQGTKIKGLFEMFNLQTMDSQSLCLNFFFFIKDEVEMLLTLELQIKLIWFIWELSSSHIPVVIQKQDRQDRMQRQRKLQNGARENIKNVP